MDSYSHLPGLFCPHIDRGQGLQSECVVQKEKRKKKENVIIFKQHNSFVCFLFEVIVYVCVYVCVCEHVHVCVIQEHLFSVLYTVYITSFFGTEIINTEVGAHLGNKKDLCIFS